MKIFLSCLFILWHTLALAQVHDLSKSYPGYLLTLTDSIHGNISIDMASNTLMLKSRKGLTNFAAKEIKKAVFFDQKGEVKTVVSGYWGSEQQAYLFEAIVTGSTPLLYREGLRFAQHDEEDFPPFFTKVQNSVFSLGSRRTIMNFLEEFGSYGDFVKKHKLKIKEKQDLILLFCHVNGIDPVDVSAIAGDDL